jgi:hypothetical protein
MKPAELWRRLLFLLRGNRMTEELEEEMLLHTELRAGAPPVRKPNTDQGGQPRNMGFCLIRNAMA